MNNTPGTIFNNSLYTTDIKEDVLEPLTPEEEVIDYARTFLPEEPEYGIDLFRVQNQLEKAFHYTGYDVHITSRPVDGNPFYCTHGFETPKDEVEYLTDILDSFGIEYQVKHGAYRTVSGRVTNKRMSFVELKNGINDYYKIYNKTDEIPFLIGDVII